MAIETGISWCDSTWNGWIGCTKIGPGCDSCYAEALDKRMKYGGASHWGAGVPRYRTSESNWRQPIAWNKKAAAGEKPWRVFCASLADVFDNEAPNEWRADLWKLIEATPHLSWLLVTKRIGNARGMMPASWFDDSGPPYGFPLNVRILITICNQEEAYRDIPKLLALPCKNGISYEPALGPVNWAHWLDIAWSPTLERYKPLNGFGNKRKLDWIIVGGESAQVGHKARPFVHGWARDTIRQCRAASVPAFIKQMGSNAVNREGMRHFYKDRAGADISEWPADLRVREFPID